jgi:hypothetical protein
MRIFIINTDYPAFLRGLYAEHHGMAKASYAEQMSLRNDSLFGVFDAYSTGFRNAGHEAVEVHANNGVMQTAWMKESGFKPPALAAPARPSLLKRVIGRFAPAALAKTVIDSSYTLRPATPIEGWTLADMLVEQVKAYRPDVILNQSVSEVGSDLLMRMKPFTGKIIGQIASPLPENETYTAYDAMLSSLPNFVSYYQGRGMTAHLNRLGFDPRVLQKIGPLARSVDVSFVGSISPAHAARTRMLEHLARSTDIAIWGGGVDQLDPASPIVARHRGEAWGRQMFSVLGSSKITINNHISIAGDFANNMRLFEATGMGTLLITDRKSNIAEIFVPGEEVVCYDSAEECVELIRYYLQNEAERERIARAGQHRTLTEHNYDIRTKEIVALIS